MYDYVIAADEVGRGCFAGNVFVAGVLIPTSLDRVDGVDDSKKVPEKKREELFPLLTQNPDIAWVVVSRGVKDIEAKGVDKTTIEAFMSVVETLVASVPVGKTAVIKIDGRQIWSTSRYVFPTEFIVHGDSLVWEIGAASIIAKVSRDRYMIELAEKFPRYHWEKNKGYGTADHIEAIQRYGLTEVHRRKFCRNFSKQQALSEDILDIFKDM